MSTNEMIEFLNKKARRAHPCDSRMLIQAADRLREQEKDRERYQFIKDHELGTTCYKDGTWSLFIRGGWSDEYKTLDAAIDHYMTPKGAGSDEQA